MHASWEKGQGSQGSRCPISSFSFLLFLIGLQPTSHGLQPCQPRAKGSRRFPWGNCAINGKCRRRARRGNRRLHRHMISVPGSPLERMGSSCDQKAFNTRTDQHGSTDNLLRNNNLIQDVQKAWTFCLTVGCMLMYGGLQCQLWFGVPQEQARVGHIAFLEPFQPLFYSPNSVSTLRGSYGRCRSLGSIRVRSLSPCVLAAQARRKVSF